MAPPDTPGRQAPSLTLPYLDPVAVELTAAIHGGNLDALRRLVRDRPQLASVRMIGRNGSAGGWRTSLHAATDWPRYFPAAPAAVTLLLDAGADPNADSGGDRPEMPLHWAASTDDVDVAVVLIDGGADLEIPGGSIGTPLDNAIGYGCWHVARLLVSRGAPVESNGQCDPPRRTNDSYRRSRRFRHQRSANQPSSASPTDRDPIGLRRVRQPPRPTTSPRMIPANTIRVATAASPFGSERKAIRNRTASTATTGLLPGR